MAARAEQRGAGGRPGDDGIGRPCRAEDEQLRPPEKVAGGEVVVGCGGSEHVQEALYRVGGRRRTLVEVQLRPGLFDDEVGEGATGVDG